MDEKLKLCYKAVNDKKGINVVALDLKGRAAFTYYFLICSGSSSRQVQSIVDEIIKQLKSMGIKDINVEGYQSGRWALIDCYDIVIHIFHEEARDFYNIERLWGDSPHVSFN